MASESLHVANLPEGLDEEMVTQFFAIYGTVTACKAQPGAGGKTAAIVKFASADEAKSVMEMLNSTVPAGLEEALSIQYAHPAAPGRPAAAAPGVGAGGAASSFGKWQGGGSAAMNSNPWSSGAGKGPGDAASWAEPSTSDNVYVQGLPVGTSQESAMQTFAEFGEVVSIKVLDKPGMPVAALVRFKEADAAKLVKEILNGAQPEGFPGPLKVRFANQATAVASTGKGQGSWQEGGWQEEKGGWQQQKGGWQQAGKGGKGKGKIEADALINLVLASGYLPGGSNYRNDDASVYVAGLPVDADVHQMYRMFAPYGAIHTVHVKMSPDGQHVYAFINYLDAQSAEASVVAFNGMELPTGGFLRANIKSRQGQPA